MMQMLARALASAGNARLWPTILPNGCCATGRSSHSHQACRADCDRVTGCRVVVECGVLCDIEEVTEL